MGKDLNGKELGRGITQSIFDKHAIKRSDTSKSTICYQ